MFDRDGGFVLRFVLRLLFLALFLFGLFAFRGLLFLFLRGFLLDFFRLALVHQSCQIRERVNAVGWLHLCVTCHVVFPSLCALQRVPDAIGSDGVGIAFDHTGIAVRAVPQRHRGLRVAHDAHRIAGLVQRLQDGLSALPRRAMRLCSASICLIRS